MGVPLATAFVQVKPRTDKKAFEKDGREAGEAAGKEFADGFYRDSSGRLRQANGRFATDAQKQMLGAGESSGRSFSKGFGKGVSSGSDKTSVFGRVAATTAAKIGLVGIAAGAATPGVLHLTAALAPAAGALLAVPAAIGAVVVASSTLKLATAGVSKAIEQGFTGSAKQAEKAMEALPPAARTFAKSILSLKPQLKDLRAQVSERFFLPLTDDIKPLANKYLPMLKKRMSDLAGPLGGLAEQFTETARRARIFNTVRTVFDATRKSVINIRGAIDPLLWSLALLVGDTVKELPKLALGFSNAAERLTDFVAAAHDSGAITAAFRAGVATLKELGGILVNVGSIFVSVFSAAGTASGGLLGNLRDLTGQAAEFLRSAQGVGALNAIFSTLAQFGAALRTGLGAVLPAIADALAILGPALAGLAGPAGNLIVALAPLLPLLAGSAATIITELTPAIADLSQFLAEHTRIVQAAAVALGVWMAALKVSAALIAVQTAGGLLAYLKGIQLVTAATKIWTGVQIAFQAVMALNVFVLAAIAIAALVAGIIYAYQHSEKFRVIVQAVWAAIKTAISATVTWITGTAWPAIKAAWDAIAGAALWLWHTVLEPVWNGIKAVIGVVIGVVKGYIALLVAEFRVIAAVATWLYTNIFSPIFAAIRKIVEIWWLAVQIVFKAFTNLVQYTLGPIIGFLRDVFTAAFNIIVARAKAWWAGVQAAFNLFRAYVIGPIQVALNFLRGVFAKIFSAIGSLVSVWYRAFILPIFTGVKNAWNALASAFSSIYNTKIKPFFSMFIGFIQDKVVKGFNTAVEAIRKAWDKVKEYARKPVAFVVNSVINPFINGLNKAARIVGVKDQVEPIKGFADGGQIPGYATGGRIAGAPSGVDNRMAPARIPGVGAVKLAGGEYVVNAKDTAKALPLLQWINAGMKSGGPREAQRRIGRPMADMPGDGSEGWAFKDGGLVGWVKDVWGAVTNPVETIKKPFESLLKKIPGSGMIKDFLTGAAKKMLGGAVNWLTGIGNGKGGGNVGKTQAFIRAQAGKPYVWASAGPNGYDCSGIVSAAWNLMRGKNPYSHTFSTESLPGGFFRPGKIGPLMAGWSHPGQSPASSSTGHMAGQIGALPFESRGSKGVVIGGNARRITDFASKGAAALAAGGRVPIFDMGGVLSPGLNTVYNGLGRPEPLVRADNGGRPIEPHFHFHAPVGDKKAAADLVYGAWKDLRRDGRIS